MTSPARNPAVLEDNTYHQRPSYIQELVYDEILSMPESSTRNHMISEFSPKSTSGNFVSRFEDMMEIQKNSVLIQYEQTVEQEDIDSQDEILC